jgi:biopolymer transport protein ExbB
MSECSQLHAIDCAGRAADQAAAIVRRQLSRGATSLWAVACMAPLVGMFGTAVGAMSALRAYHNPGYDDCDCAGGPAEAFVSLVLSLPVAVFASAGFHWLNHRVDSFDLEMRTTTLDLLNRLARWPPERRIVVDPP